MRSIKFRKLPLVVITLIGVVILMNACKHGQCPSKGRHSSAGSDESHNMGQNCLSCHMPDGPGRGCWKVAGTVYHENLSSLYPGTTVDLYTAPEQGGLLKYTLEVDGNGNFYTDEVIDFGNGLYPTVRNAAGDSKDMPTAITIGACSSCHGISTDRVWVK